MLETINLHRTFTSDSVDYEVLRGIDLSIGSGESVAIVGNSGSGKSTLMHILACLDEPTLGSVSFQGRDYSALSEKQRDKLRNESFGFVFQQFFLNGRDTVFENVVLPMKIRGESSGLHERAMDALDAVGLGDKAEKRAKDLSGGEKQRVCIARALVGDPSVIFADEPTGNLDSKTSRKIEDLILSLNRDKGITVVVVTHDQDLAARCGRTINLKDGTIVDALEAGEEDEE